jgi:hypothetical protein
VAIIGAGPAGLLLSEILHRLRRNALKYSDPKRWV